MKRRRIITVAGLALVAALVVVLLMARNQAAQSTIAIGDFRVSFVGVATHAKPFTTEKKWHPWARKLLPGHFQKWIPTPQMVSPGGISNASVWIVIRVAPSSRDASQTLPWVGYRSESLAGDEYEEQNDGPISFSGTSKDTRLLSIVLNSFPRRDPAFHIRFVAKDGTTVGVLRVPNVTPGPLPVWTPRSLPQTVTNDGVALTLKEVTVVPREPTNSKFIGGPNTGTYSISRLWPEFEEMAKDSAWKNASFADRSEDDATGNDRATLPRSEAAWRIKAQVQRSYPSQYAPEEKLILTSLAPTNAVLGAVAFRIPDPNTLQSFGGKSNESKGLFTGKFSELREPHIIVETDLTNGLPLCFAFNQAGKQINGYSTTELPETRGSVRRFRFTIENLPSRTASGPASWSRIEIFVSRPKVFEFFINPADVKTNAAVK